MAGPTGDVDPPLFVGALRFRGAGFSVWAGTNEAELFGGGVGGAPTWAQVLAAGRVTGGVGNNPHIDSGDIISFGDSGALPVTGTIRSSTDIEMRAAGGLELISDATMQLQAIGLIPIRFVTNAIERLRIGGDGAWRIDGDEGTAGQVLTSNGPGATPTWEDAPGSTPGWDDVLAVDNNSGANNPHIDTGQFLGFGVEGSLPGAGQIRSSADLTINVTGAAALIGSTTASVTAGGNGLAASSAAFAMGAGSAGVTGFTNAELRLQSGGANPIRLLTNSTERLEIEGTGAWQLGGAVGTAGQYIRSAGAGAPPTWATIPFSEVSGGTWADVLGKGATSGANNPSINSGQHLAFAGGGVGGGDIRSTNALSIVAGSALALTATGANSIQLFTNGVERLEIESDGAWQLAGNTGTSGQVLTSNGSSAPPSWQTAAASLIFEDGGVSQGSASTIDVVDAVYTTGTVIVALGQATMAWDVAPTPLAAQFAGDGLDAAAGVMSVDVSDFAGSGLEDDGANNLRIAAAAAGAGLTGGGGSALAVGAGTGIQVNANDVQLAPALAESFVGNFTAGSAAPGARAGSSVAGNGLTYTAGGTLAVGAGTGIAVNANDVAVDLAAGFTWTGVHSFTGSSHDIDVTGAVSINADAASNFTTSVGNLTLQTTEAGSRVIVSGADDVLIEAVADDIFLNSGGLTQFTSGTAITMIMATLFRVTTNSVERLEITADGAYQVNGSAGTAGQVLTSAGASAPAAWANPSGSEPHGLMWFRYTFDVSTTMADPGAGDIRLNNANPDSVTQIAIDDADEDGISVGLGGSQSPFSWGRIISSVVTIRSRATPSKYATYRATTGNDQAGYWDLTVTHLSSAGGSFADGEELDLTWTPNGNNTFLAPVALDADMETGTNLALVVPPGRQHRHPSAAKCWGFTTGGGTPVLDAVSFNVTSIGDTGTGILTVNIGTDFSSASYVVVASTTESAATVVKNVSARTKAAGSVILDCDNDAGTAQDPSVGYDWVMFGDQA